MSVQELIINGEVVEYTVRKSARAKRARIHIDVNGIVELVVPKQVPIYFAKKFLETKKEWIQKQLKKIKKRSVIDKRLLVDTDRQYKEYKKEAEVFCKNKVEEWNAKIGYPYKKITVKRLKTRWGSCSSKKNLNFNYKIIFLPEEKADYIIVHELCHLKEMNHSSRFWALVEKWIPDYKVLRKM